MLSAQPLDVPDDAALTAYIESAAILLGLPLALEWRPQILFHLKAITLASNLVQAFPLDDSLEPAPVYEA